MNFYKYQGTGNDFVMVDNRSGHISLEREQVEKLCDRRFGIGADGLILLENGPGRHKMVYYNSDGRESTMCGNGGRCFVRFAEELGLVRDNVFSFDAVDGLHEARIEGETVFLQMKDCGGFAASAEGFVLDTGSPHFVMWAEPSFWDDENFVHRARAIRNRPEFREKGINVNFICETADGALRIRTFERGVEDETYSCGTGVTAAALVYGAQKNHRTVRLQSKGGPLSVSFEAEPSGAFTGVLLVGPALKVFEGHLQV